MIYIHVPFCKSFCVYCGFYSELCSGSDAARRQELFVSALCREIDARRSEIGAHFSAMAAPCDDGVDVPLSGEKGRSTPPRTLYIGGGTPSQLPAALLRRLVEALPPDAGRDEFTVEVNPDDIVTLGPGYVRELLSMGVGRISMGVQSFDDGVLRWMRRRHSAAAAREAFRIVRSAGVRNISIDIIFGIAGLSDEALLQTLQEVISLRPEHVSAYQLSPDEGSDLYDMIASGGYEPMDDESCRRQYEMVCRTLREAGYSHYEVSNWALPGREAVHNSAYWRRSPYIGLGPGAHSFDGERRRWNSEALWSDGSVSWTMDGETLTADQTRTEVIMLGLRTAGGVDASWLEDNCAPDAIASLLASGSLVPVATDGHNPVHSAAVGAAQEQSLRRLRIPESRFFVSDDIIASLI